MGLPKITHLISAEMSAFGGKAEVIYRSRKSPLIAKSGHLPRTENSSFQYRRVNIVGLSCFVRDWG
jgi:hypothetical protein